MQIIWEGRIAGAFHGYAGGRVHELSDGPRWRQADRTDEPVYRKRPTARLVRDEAIGSYYLDVEGTSGTVEVVPEAGPRG